MFDCTNFNVDLGKELFILTLLVFHVFQFTMYCVSVWFHALFTRRSTALLLRLFSKIHTNQANLCRDSMTVASRMVSFDSSSRRKRVRTFGELVRWLRSGVGNISRYLQLSTVFECELVYKLFQPSSGKFWKFSPAQGPLFEK